MKIDYQIQAIKSLRKGIEQYDKRQGWRGPITNKMKNKDWKKLVEKYKLDPTLNWKIASINEISDTEIRFDILKDSEKIQSGILKLEKLKWSLRKKKFPIYIKLETSYS